MSSSATGPRQVRVAVVAVLVGDQHGVQRTGQLARRDRRLLDLPGRLEIGVGGDQEAVGPDQPAGVAHPPQREARLGRPDLVAKRARRVGHSGRIVL
jgi:hypothetical protein